jgi:hypothetical protein
MTRYNKLLKVIHQTSQDLLKALKGLLVMSQELENMANSLFNNTVPYLWAKNVWAFEYIFLMLSHTLGPKKISVSRSVSVSKHAPKKVPI